MCHLIPGPLPCPEVVAVSYIRPAEVPTLFSIEGDAQVEQQNTVVGFLTQDVLHGDTAGEELGLARLVSSYTLPHQNSQPGRRGRQTARIKVLSRRARDT